jgi:hypothetical protein
MTNKEIAQYLLDIANNPKPLYSYFFICNHLDRLLDNNMISVEEYWEFRELLWTYVDQAMLITNTKCKYLDHHYSGGWFKSKAERVDALNKILTLT